MILDFGNVLVYPTSGDWNMTPVFMKNVNPSGENIEQLKALFKKYSYYLDEKLLTTEEEFEMFKSFYGAVLSECDWFKYDEEKIREIAYNRTYELDKYTLFEEVKDELEKLSKKYKLIMLTDNWPCVIDYLKHYDLLKYFEKVYISSFYAELKREGVFFDHPVEDFKINPSDVIFIDDHEDILDVAHEKGFIVYQMDRKNTVKSSKYEIIHDLSFFIGK